MRFLLSASALLFLVAPRFGSAQEESPIVKELRRQKLVHLKAIYEAQQKGYETGGVALEDLLHASMNYFDGALEVAESPRQHMEILESALRVAEQLVKTATTKYQAGEGGVADVHKANVALLDRRIAYQKEREAYGKQSAPISPSDPVTCYSSRRRRRSVRQ